MYQIYDLDEIIAAHHRSHLITGANQTKCGSSDGSSAQLHYSHAEPTLHTTL